MTKAKRASRMMASCDFAGVEKDGPQHTRPTKPLGPELRRQSAPAQIQVRIAFKPRLLNLQFHASLTNGDSLV
jgi:hypothetical protein